MFESKVCILVYTISSYYSCLVWPFHPNIWLTNQTPTYVLLLGLDSKASTPSHWLQLQDFLTSPCCLGTSWRISISLPGHTMVFLHYPSSFCTLDYPPWFISLLFSRPPPVLEATCTPSLTYLICLIPISSSNCFICYIFPVRLKERTISDVFLLCFI